MMKSLFNFHNKLTILIRDSRQKFIKAKYEQHLFIKNLYTNDMLNEFIDYCKTNQQSKVFEMLTQIFAQFDFLAPLSNDVIIK